MIGVVNRFCLLAVLMILTTVGPPAHGAQDQLVTDALNRKVNIGVPVRRLVVLPSDALEIVRLLGGGDRVVGINSTVSQRVLFWRELKDRSVVGHPFEPNYEQVVALKPDLVLAYGSRPGGDLESKLAPAGIQVLRLDFFRLSSLMREVRDFGRLLGKERQAEAYARWHDRCVALLKQRLESVQRRPRVYLEGYADRHASGPGSGGYEMGTFAGGDLISSKLKISSSEISTEFLISVDPEIIVKLVSHRNPYEENDPGPLKEIRRRIMDRPGWSCTTAVKTGRVYALSADIGPGPRGIIGILHMAKIFYPEEFADVDVRKIHQEYLEKFQKVPFRGHYAFP